MRGWLVAALRVLAAGGETKTVTVKQGEQTPGDASAEEAGATPTPAGTTAEADAVVEAPGTVAQRRDVFDGVALIDPDGKEEVPRRP